MGTVLQLEDARGANLGAGLGDDALEAAIDEEEAWLASKIGPLTGERTQRLPLAYLRPLHSEIRLRRPTGSVVVTQDGIELAEVEVRGNGWVVANLPEGTRYTGVLLLTYTPNDEALVRRALKQLVGLTTSATAGGDYVSETMGTYSYTKGTLERTAAIRASIVRDLLNPPQAGSIRLRSSVPHGLAGALDR